MPEKFKGKKTEKAGAAVEEEHLLSLINVFDNNDMILDTGASMMYTQLDIQGAYHFTTIGDVTVEDDIPDLEAPTEYEDEEKVSELKISCANEDDVEVDYEFHNDAAFVQVELCLEDEDVEDRRKA